MTSKTLYAPSERVYRAPRHLVQQRLVDRDTMFRAALERSSSSAKARQSTLTQLDFILDLPSDDGFAFSSNQIYEDDDAKPRKRRRTQHANLEQRQQQTLTQIDFFDMRSSWDADDESEISDDMSRDASKGSSTSSRRRKLPLQVVNSHGSDADEDEQENVDPDSSRGNIMKKERLDRDNDQAGSAGLAESSTRRSQPRPIKSPSTPSRPLRKKVPSSQSPASSFSSSNSSSSSPSKSPRSPLHDISQSFISLPSRPASASSSSSAKANAKSRSPSLGNPPFPKLSAPSSSQRASQLSARASTPHQIQPTQATTARTSQAGETQSQLLAEQSPTRVMNGSAKRRRADCDDDGSQLPESVSHQFTFSSPVSPSPLFSSSWAVPSPSASVATIQNTGGLVTMSQILRDCED